MSLENCECKKCGYKWQKRILNPVRCPFCNNLKWDRPYVRARIKQIETMKLNNIINKEEQEVAKENKKLSLHNPESW